MRVVCVFTHTNAHLCTAAQFGWDCERKKRAKNPPLIIHDLVVVLLVLASDADVFACGMRLDDVVYGAHRHSAHDPKPYAQRIDGDDDNDCGGEGNPSFVETGFVCIHTLSPTHESARSVLDVFRVMLIRSSCSPPSRVFRVVLNCGMRPCFQYFGVLFAALPEGVFCLCMCVCVLCVYTSLPLTMRDGQTLSCTLRIEQRVCVNPPALKRRSAYGWLDRWFVDTVVFSRAVLTKMFLREDISN